MRATAAPEEAAFAPRTGTGVRRLRIAPTPSASPTLLLVANANASGLARNGALVERARDLLRRSGARVETLLTESVAQLEALWPSDPERRVVLLGGDGSVHAAANLPGPHPELALIPVGRANNIAASLGIPTDPRRAAEVAVRGAARPLDLIAAKSEQRRYLAVEGVSVGFLALARARYRAQNSADLGAALSAGALALARFRPFCVAIESDGTGELVKLSQLFVANLPLYGFGLRVAPNADPADGLLDLVTIETGGRGGLPVMLARLRRGSHAGRKGARQWRARRVRIATDGRSPAVADSTNLGAGTIELEVAPEVLNVVVPAL